MHPVVLLAVGYAALLLVVAGVLEALARHAAARAERHRTAGFTYQPLHDLWTCPRDEPLWRYEVDRQRRLVRYRARPTVCNACPVVADCTTSRDGREIVRPIDPWPHSEAGRFHRALSVTLAVLAVAFLAVTTAAHHQRVDLTVLLPATGVANWLLWRWALELRNAPSGFPEAAPARYRPTRRSTDEEQRS